MKAVILVLAVAGVLIALAMWRQRTAEKPKALEKLRSGVEEALEDVEGRARELRVRAEKLRGEARTRLQERVHELEARQRDLRERLDEMKAEARRLLERAKA